MPVVPCILVCSFLPVHLSLTKQLRVGEWPIEVAAGEKASVGNEGRIPRLDMVQIIGGAGRLGPRRVAARRRG
jgi:hypothetical protein